MLKDYVLTFAIIITYLFIASEFFLRIHFRRTGRGVRKSFMTETEAGILFGLLGILLITLGVEFRSYGIMDLRHLAVLVPGVLFGGRSAVIAACIISAARFGLYGFDAGTSVSAVFLMLMAILFVPLRRMEWNRHFLFLLMNLMSPLVIVMSVYTKFTLFGIEGSPKDMFSYNWWMMYVFGFLSYYAASYIFSSHEAALRHKETSSQLTALMTHFQTGILHETTAGSITFMNEAFERIFPTLYGGLIGRQGDEAVLQFAELIVHPEEFISRRKEVLQNRKPVLNEEWQLQDGRTIEFAYIPIFSDRQEYMGNMWKFRDITDRKCLEEQEAMNKQMYQSLFEYNRSACFMIGLDGRLTRVNQAAEQVTGYPKGMLLGTPFMPLVHCEDLPNVMEHFQGTLEGRSDTFEMRLIQMSGQTVELIVNCSPLIVQDEIIGIIGLAHDVTEQKRVAREHLESIARYQKLVELSPEVVFVHGQESFEFINERAVDLLGVGSTEEVLGRSFLDFIHPEDQYTAALNMAQMFFKRQGQHAVNEYQIKKRDGGWVNVEIRSALIEYNGQPAVLGIVHDITKKKEAEQKLKQANAMLQKLSRIDGLTSIPNRRFYDEKLAAEWQRAVANQTHLTIMMIDIDAFKAYNDLYGHQQGDACLKMVAGAIETALNRPNDFVARYGGEEFSVILPHMDEDGAAKVAAAICAAVTDLRMPHAASSILPHVTVSVGTAAVIPDQSMTAEDVLRCADEALYQAKRNGRNQAVVYTKFVYEENQTI